MSTPFTQRRKQAGFPTQESLAAYLCVTTRSVSSWDRGEHTPPHALVLLLDKLIECRNCRLTRYCRQHKGDCAWPAN